MSILNFTDEKIDSDTWISGIWKDVIWSTSAEISKQILEKLELEKMLIWRIEKLPPIPKTIIEIEMLRKSNDIDNRDLLRIIENDAIIVANILKVANSAMYCFSSKVKTVQMAMNLLWFNMVSNIAISTAINKILKPNLAAYDVNIDDFISISSTQSRIIEQWQEPKIMWIKSDLQLAAFLQELWKIIISMIIIEKNIVNGFKKRILSWEEIHNAEESIISKSSAEVTAMIFTQWKFNKQIIELIHYSDKPETAPKVLQNWVYALKIVKTLFPVLKDGLCEKTIKKSLELAKLYWFNTRLLENVIDNFNNKKSKHI